METLEAQPTHKDTAEFLRLGLHVEVCSVAAVVRWADSIISVEPSPSFAFIELSLCGSQSVDDIISLLSEVPGRSTPELPVCMLLGYCSGLVRSGSHNVTKVLLRLYFTAILEGFPEPIINALSGYEDEFSLASDHVCGTLPEITERFSSFLNSFEPYTHAIPIGII